MPRRSRTYLPGLPYHIVQRGNNRDPCFYDEMDYRYSLQTLEEQAGDPRLRVACIGPAGERLVRFAAVMAPPTKPKPVPLKAAPLMT